MPQAKRQVRDIEDRFWHVEAGAGTLKAGMWRLRPADDDWYVETRPRLFQGKRVALGRWPSPAPLFTYDEVGSCPDVACTLLEPPHIVSSALRGVIESIDPGAAQFLPIRVDGPRRATIASEYWMINWLRVWDCLPSADSMSLDASRVPVGEHIGIVPFKHRGRYGALICDLAFKKAVSARGILGLRYHPASLATGPEGIGHYRDRAGKRTKIERRLLPGDSHFDVDAFLDRFPGASFPDQREGSNALYEYMFLHQGPDFSLATLRKLLNAGYSPNSTSPIDPPIPVFFHPRSPSVLRLLHQHGVDWNRPNMIGITPLMSAAMDGEAGAVRLMLEFGADPHARSGVGQTALHHAAKGASTYGSGPAKGYLDTIRLLLEAGVDPSIRDRSGETAADCAGRSERRTPAAEGRWRRFVEALSVVPRKS